MRSRKVVSSDAHFNRLKMNVGLCLIFEIRHLKFECYVGLSLIFDIQNLNVGLSFIFNHFDVRHSNMNVMWD